MRKSPANLIVLFGSDPDLTGAVSKIFPDHTTIAENLERLKSVLGFADIVVCSARLYTEVQGVSLDVIKAICKEMKIPLLVMSGSLDAREGSGPEEHEHLLVKPFTIEEYEEKILSVVNEFKRKERTKDAKHSECP